MPGSYLLASPEPLPGCAANQDQSVGLIGDVGTALPPRVLGEGFLSGSEDPGRELLLMIVDSDSPGLNR
eukprot:12498090-Heterocapsa_arctica.AAC.1